MNQNWAEENLKTIRTLMERSAIYRRALAPIMIYVGTVGIFGGVVGTYLKDYPARKFVSFWAGIAALALAGSFLLVRRQSLKNSEPFWSPPTRRVAQALIPPFTVGAFIAIIFCSSNNLSEYKEVLIWVWCWMYGCAIYSAGFFMPRGFKVFGLMFILAGFLLALFDLTGGSWRILSDGGWMSATFGGLHLAYGIYLYFTEKKNPVA